MKAILTLLTALLPVLVQAQTVESLYVSTDRSVYIAGDEVWCSVFCLDANKGRLSDFSAVSYLELVSGEGTVATAKIGLVNGRGAGKFRIPVSAPTGNYRLVAYTACGSASYLDDARTLSVFNTTSTARVKDGVKLVAENPSKAPEKPAEGLLELSLSRTPKAGEAFELNLVNRGKSASLSLSVYADDELPAPASEGLSAFLQRLPASPARFASARGPEYEGEIIYAAVEGLSALQIDSLSGMSLATLSSAGSPSDVYVGKVGDKGKIQFFTNNIYGDRELVCEVKDASGYISLSDPFRRPAVEDVPPLPLCAGQYGALVQRKAAMASALQTDTLVQFLPRRQDFLLSDADKIRYHLDNYTRFPSLQEVLVEIVKELRIRNVHGERSLQMVVPDAVNSRKVVKDNLLVMLDGVVISDLSLLEGMDALLLEDIDLYPETIALGGVSFGGVVNFITRKNYVTALQFPANVRVLDFKGVCYPVAYPGTPVSGIDYRQLLYWHPLLELREGERLRLPLTAPVYNGAFRVVAEGLDADGKPVYREFRFNNQ